MGPLCADSIPGRPYHASISCLPSPRPFLTQLRRFRLFKIQARTIRSYYANCQGSSAVLHSVSACSDTHRSDRNRTCVESKFPINRLYSDCYAWPLLCTKTRLLKQNGSPCVVQACGL